MRFMAVKKTMKTSWFRDFLMISFLKDCAFTAVKRDEAF